MEPIIKISHLDKYFGKLHVLNDISIEIAPNEVCCLIGKSGSGKSTLLRCINFLEEPSAGIIEVDGLEVHVNVKGKQRRQLVHDLRLKTGMVFQEFNLFPHLSVIENVIEGPITVKNMDKAKAIELAEMNLERVGMCEKRDEFPSRLSGGQKQRVAIARALVMEPKVMLFDEPTSALDPELIGEVLAVMCKLAEEGTTMLVVTHEMDFAKEVGERIIVLSEGEVIEEGSPDKLFSSPQDKRTQSLLERYKN